MASYKVLQDIEAEDKIVGPLTLKQLIYAAIAAVLIVGSWYLGSKTTFWAMGPFMPPALVFTLLALPLNRDQPNDVWLLARLNFAFRPRKRLWQRSSGSHKSLIVQDSSDTEAGSKAPVKLTMVEELETKAFNLSSVLDSRNQTVEDRTRLAPTAVVATAATDGEHENRHSGLNHKFHQLLGSHHNQRKENADLKIRQTLRAQSHNLSRSPAESGGKSFKTPPNSHLSAKISEIAGSGDLKISTLESMVKAIKSKDKLKKKNKK